MMKPITKMTGILFAVILFTVIFPKQASAQQPFVSFQIFYDQLTPYGQWVDFRDYGYVWLPAAGADFFPYSSNGQWIMTEYGWTWLSYYDWGWAPFHYGRWDYDSYYGWFWVPDNIWGPAWVTWRRTRGYYGWAPMSPGMNITMSYGMGYNNYNNHWIFVRERYFGRNNLYRYYASHNDYEVLIGNSTVINNTYIDNSRHTTYVSGPDKGDVQQTTGRRVSSYSIQENNVPGHSLTNGQYRIYRPEVVKNTDNAERTAPTTVTILEEVKQPSERTPAYRQEYLNTGGGTRWEQNQDVARRQNAVDQQNTLNRQNAESRQNALDEQNTVNRENAVKRQDAVDLQNTNNRKREQEQIVVNRQNTLNRQKAVDQQDDVNRQNTADQKEAVARQNSVNRQNAEDQQKAVNQQNAVNQRSTRNNEKSLNQQNVNNSNNERRVQPVNSVKNSKNIRSDESKKSRSLQEDN
jgi:hypothetical protein